MSLPFSGTTSTTTDSDCTVSPLFLRISRPNWRLPDASGFSGTNTHSPRSSAVTSPRDLSLSRMVTVLPGLARPAMTASPSGVTRTTSNLRESDTSFFGLPATGGVVRPVSPATTCSAGGATSVTSSCQRT